MDSIKSEIELAQDTEAMFSSVEATAIAANQERTQDRFIRRVLIPLAFLIVGAVLGSMGANAITAHEAATADWTVPACSVYKYTSTPDLPPYTRTDLCYTQNTDGGYTVSTGAHVKTAGY